MGKRWWAVGILAVTLAAALLRPAVEGLYRCCFGAEPASEGDIRRMRRVLFALYRTPRT